MPKIIPIPDPFAPASNGGRPTTAGDSSKLIINASMTPRSIQNTAAVRNRPAVTPNTPSEKAKSVTSGAKSKAKKTSPGAPLRAAVKDLTVVSSPYSGDWKKHHLTPSTSYLRPDGVLIKGV